MPDGFGRAPRLASEDYLGPIAAHVITVTRRRLPLFENDELASACLGAIQRTAARFDVLLHAYCLMPDHAHFLLEIPDGISLETVVHHFKTTSGYVLKRLTGEAAWQPSYYDHLLRREEALEDVAAYIWANPVTAGLVSAAEQYKWSGPRDAKARA